MNDEKKTYILMYAGWFLSVFLLWYMFSRGVSTNIQNGTEHIEYELDTAYGYQQSAQADIERAERYVEASQVRLDGASVCTERIQAGVDESSRLIAECQQIVARVQARGAITQTQN